MVKIRIGSRFVVRSVDPSMRMAADVVQIVPLDIEVVIALDNLPRSFYGDPADRLMVSTSRTHKIPLATHDAAIRNSGVAAFWKAA